VLRCHLAQHRIELGARQTVIERIYPNQYPIDRHELLPDFIQDIVGRVGMYAARFEFLEAAAGVLQEHGYGGFTIEAVARRAMSGRPTIYRWWPNKAALISELYVTQTGSLMRPQPDTGSLVTDLVKQIEKLWNFWKRTACGRAFRALIAEAQAYPDALEQLREYTLEHARGITRGIFENARHRGEIRSDVDIEIAPDVIYGFQWYRLLTDQLDNKAVRPAVEMLVGGLMAR
jgi:AcrR family transcriptional regulator